MGKRLLLTLLVISLLAVGLSACGGGGAPKEEAPKGVVSVGAVELNPRPATLEGKTVVLRWNGKHNGDNFLNRVGELLTEQVKDIKIIKMWEVEPDTAAMSESLEVSEEFAAKIAQQKPDLVIAMQCD